jgi:hypothetical protein
VAAIFFEGLGFFEEDMATTRTAPGLNVSLTGGTNAAASLHNPFPNLPPTSSFPNFVAKYATRSTVYREQAQADALSG